MSASFEMINGVPNYNLYIAGEWTRSFRNETTESKIRQQESFLRGSSRPAQPKPKKPYRGSKSDKSWFETPVSQRENYS